MKIYLKRNEYTSYNELGENLSVEKLFVNRLIQLKEKRGV